MVDFKLVRLREPEFLFLFLFVRCWFSFTDTDAKAPRSRLRFARARVVGGMAGTGSGSVPGSNRKRESRIDKEGLNKLKWNGSKDKGD